MHANGTERPRNRKGCARFAFIRVNWRLHLSSYCFGFWISDFFRHSNFGIRFVLLKLHAKWLQFFVVSGHILEFPRGITYCGKTAIYKHLQQQEHWHRGTRRPRVSQKCVFGPMAKLCPIWFWLCQVRISEFVIEQTTRRNPWNNPTLVIGAAGAPDIAIRLRLRRRW